MSRKMPRTAERASDVSYLSCPYYGVRITALGLWPAIGLSDILLARVANVTMEHLIYLDTWFRRFPSQRFRLQQLLIIVIPPVKRRLPTQLRLIVLSEAAF